MPTKAQIGIVIMVIAIISLIGVITLKDEQVANTMKKASTAYAEASDLRSRNADLAGQLLRSANELNQCRQQQSKGDQQCPKFDENIKSDLKKVCATAKLPKSARDVCKKYIAN